MDTFGTDMEGGSALQLSAATVLRQDSSPMTEMDPNDSIDIVDGFHDADGSRPVRDGSDALPENTGDDAGHDGAVLGEARGPLPVSEVQGGNCQIARRFDNLAAYLQSYLASRVVEDEEKLRQAARTMSSGYPIDQARSALAKLNEHDDLVLRRVFIGRLAKPDAKILDHYREAFLGLLNEEEARYLIDDVAEYAMVKEPDRLDELCTWLFLTPWCQDIIGKLKGSDVGFAVVDSTVVRNIITVASGAVIATLFCLPVIFQSLKTFSEVGNVICFIASLIIASLVLFLFAKAKPSTNLLLLLAYTAVLASGMSS